MADEASDPEVLTLVRSHVKDLLTSSHAFRGLPAERQNQVARDMTQVAAYLAAPESIKANTLPGAVTIVQDTRNAPGEVDFPKFVGGLISGVFQAVVDASVKQMDAYAELMKNVAQTVSEFLRDSVSDDDSRRYLATTYPEYFELDPDCQLRARDRLDKYEAIGRLSLLALEASLGNMDQHEIDRVLVPAGRRRIVAQRQQMVACMVLMGVHHAAGR
ncbi:MAG: hypothetical protein M3O35_11640 [Acidobacteriota bacterium]|nr:hypothetical protein [Acidobacteriota bacterium]